MLDFPLSLNISVPAQTPNWSVVADTVTLFSRVKRSPLQCRERFMNVIIPREDPTLAVRWVFYCVTLVVSFFFFWHHFGRARTSIRHGMFPLRRFVLQLFHFVQMAVRAYVLHRRLRDSRTRQRTSSSMMEARS